MLRLRQPKVEIMQNGHFVSRCSDFILYNVEARNIDAVVKAFGPCMNDMLLLTCVWTNGTACSHQGRRHSRRTDVV